MGAQRILLVDDDPDFSFATSAILQSAGYSVLTAEDGARGIELARAAKPDLIILDIMMSYVLEGMSVGAQLKADPELADTPILMLSAVVKTEDVGALPTDQPVPGQFYLTKPVPAAKLLETVSWMLGQRQESSAGTRP